MHFRQYWGVSKRSDLLDSLDDVHFDVHYKIAHPQWKTASPSDHSAWIAIT